MFAGVVQSIGRSTRKPRLNQEENRCAKSSSTALQVGIARCRCASKLLAHAHQRRGAAGREVEAADQFLPARLGRLVQAR